MLYRALIKTHHMTCHRKILALTKAAKTLSCSVCIKTGRPPGIMIAESPSKENISAWVDVVKRLRYKDFQVMKRPDEVEESGGSIKVGLGEVQEFEEMKELGRCLGEWGVRAWWVEGWGLGGEVNEDLPELGKLMITELGQYPKDFVQGVGE